MGQPRAATPANAPARALIDLVDQLATDIGRLRRRLEPDTLAGHLAQRVASTVEAIDCILQPTAAELYADTGDLEQALNETEWHARRFRRKLGDVIA